MSLVESYHAAHKARLARMGDAARKVHAYKPVIGPNKYPDFNIQTLYYHQMWFFDLVTERARIADGPPKIEQIQHAVSLHFGVSKIDLLSQRRTQNIVRPRQIAMYLAKTLTGRSLPDIGRRFGDRDHTTVLHAVRKITLHLAVDEATRRDVALIKASIR